MRPQSAEQGRRAPGTPGLHILVARGHGRGEDAYGELRYRWTPHGGETRFVDYRYQGDDAYMVAGPLADQKGLEAVLDMAASTGECSLHDGRRGGRHTDGVSPSTICMTSRVISGPR